MDHSTAHGNMSSTAPCSPFFLRNPVSILQDLSLGSESQTEGKNKGFCCFQILNLFFQKLRKQANKGKNKKK